MPPVVAARMDQRMIALNEANRVRLRRAALMRWMFYAETSQQSHVRAAELLLEPDEVLAGMRVEKLLARVRKVGPVQADVMMTYAGLPDRSVTVGGLSDGQRSALAALLRSRAARLSEQRSRPAALPKEGCVNG
jgi:FMN phosphatase YigB (HAD superfamily)